MSARRRSDVETSKLASSRVDPLTVQSVVKAFRVLTAFDGSTPTMGLSQLAKAVGLNKSAAQRFTHT